MAERCLESRRGFSLVEVLIASAIGSVVLATVFSLFDVAQSMLVREEIQTDLQQNARVALGRILSDIRAAREILEAESNRLRFRGDTMGDGILREVTYTFDPAQNLIRRGEGRIGMRSSGLQPLAHQIVIPAPPHVPPRPLFIYYDRNAQEILQPLGSTEVVRIHWVAVTLASQDTGRAGGRPAYVLTSWVHPRNLGL